jgi:hypothetical protein
VAAVGAVDGEVREAVGFLVAGAQRVADREAAEVPDQDLGPLEERDEVRMLDPVLAEHLLHEQERVADDFQLVGSLLLRHVERFEEARVLRDVVGGRTEVAGDLDYFRVGAKDDAIAGRSGIAARCSVDECDEFLQDAGFST